MRGSNSEKISIGSCRENGSNHIDRNPIIIATDEEGCLESKLKCLRDGSFEFSHIVHEKHTKPWIHMLSNHQCLPFPMPFFGPLGVFPFLSIAKAAFLDLFRNSISLPFLLSALVSMLLLIFFFSFFFSSAF